MAKKITLENLAEKMDEGFKKVDDRFKEAEKHTDKKIDEKIDELALAVKKGFDENTKQHQQILKVLDNHGVMLINHAETLKDHTARLKRIESKLEGVVYRKEFEEEEALAIKK